MDGSDDYTPARAIREGWSWLPAGINGVVIAGIIALAVAGVVIGIIFAVMPAGNAINQKNIKNNYDATVNSQGYQANLVSEMDQNLSNLSDLAATRQSIPAGSGEQQVVRAQEMAQLRKFCAEGLQLNFAAIPGGPELQGTYAQNCVAGAVVADPPLAPPAS